MKLAKIVISAAVVSSAFLFTACNQAELEKLKQENGKLSSEVTQLQNEAVAKDSTISEFFSSFNEIEANLATIKEKEKNIVSKNISGEVKNSVKDQIITDIQSINQLMEDNKKKLAALRANLRKANINVSQMEEMMAGLQRKIEEQGAELEQLRNDLANANAALSSLNDLYNESIADANAKEDALNTAYFVIGEFKDLKEKGVMTKEGGIIGIGSTKTMKDEFNKELFQKTDIRTTTRIQTNAKKVTLSTVHPKSSYQLVEESGKQVLIINDPKTFWSASKYLVILQEKL